jgi:GNAT superfamily N-acetyltransferase
MIREYRATDLEGVVELFGRSVHVIACRDYAPEQLAAWAPAAPNFSTWAARLAMGTVLVDEAEDRLAGFARLADNGYIDLLYGHPQFQRRGTGARLMDTMARMARERGVQRLTADASLAARSFFEAHGFVVTAEQTVERRGMQLRNLRVERCIDP